LRGAKMAEFLTTSGVSYNLEKLINSSEEKLFLISPFLQIADSLKSLIKERDSRKIDIRVVYKKDEKINAETMSFLQELTSVKILSCEHLHAKCYINENTAIITSMNLYQYSQQNNKEMGIKVEKDKEPDMYNEIYKEVMRIIQASQQPEFSIKKLEREVSVIPSGFCIRCGGDLKINLEKPLCFNCYKSWEEYSNPQYQEKFCHVCGKESATTYEKPVCYSCYKKLNN
jgi:phosphatidylserine/phosphatidylglycerophosphate/cardiolipin synthase-like enzyme